jgi:hypothetical protein
VLDAGVPSQVEGRGWDFTLDVGAHGISWDSFSLLYRDLVLG